MEMPARRIAPFAALALLCAVAHTFGAEELWRLGMADGSSTEFRPCHAWEYGRVPWLSAHPSMDAATHTFRFDAKPGETPRPDIPAEICGIFENLFMPDDEVVTGLSLRWTEEAGGSRLLRFDFASFSHSSENGHGGIEVSLPDGRKRVFGFPAPGADGKGFPFALECVVPAATGENEATLRIVSRARHESLVFDAISLRKTDASPEFPPVLEVETSAPDAIFPPGGEARLRLRLFNSIKGEAECEVSGINSNVVHRCRAAIAKGMGEIPLPTNQRGWFRIVAQCGSARAETAYCVAEPPEEGFREDSRFGCHALYGDSYDRALTTQRREATERAARRAHLAGAKWARLHYLKWSLTEPERERLDFDALDWRLGVAEKNGLRVLVNVADVPRWCSPSEDESLTVTGAKRRFFHPPTDLNAWSNFVHRLVSHCRGRVSDWEIGNEPGYTSAFWITGSPADFGPYLATAYDAAHEADPDCRIYPGAPLQTDFLAEAVDSIGGRTPWDVLSAHYLGNSKRFSNKAAGWLALNASFGKPRVLVNSEDMGWVSRWADGPLAIAADAVKLHVRDAMRGAVRTFAFCIFHAEGGRYSFFEANGAPLPAFAAYRTMTHRLEGARYVGDLSTRECEAYVFDRDGTPVTVFWNALSVPTNFRPALGAGPFKAVDPMDNESPAVPGEDGCVSVRAEMLPRYVEGGDWEAVRAALAKCATDRANAATTHTLGENIVPPDRRTLLEKNRRFKSAVDALPVRYGDTYLFAATIKGSGTLDGIVTIFDADGNELWPRKQGLNCLQNKRATGEWRTVTDTFTISEEKAASLRLVLVTDFWENAVDAPIEIRDITVAQISETHSASKALHRGAFGTDAFGPPIAIDDASAQLRLGEEGLHIRFKVVDDDFDPPAGPEKCWFRDCIQFAIDPCDDGADFTSFHLLRTDDGREILYKDRNYTTPELPDNITRRGAVADARICFARAKDGYSFDVSIPLRELYPLKADARAFGFNFLVNDSDRGGSRAYREWTEGIGGTKSSAPFGHISRQQPQQGEKQ